MVALLRRLESLLLQEIRSLLTINSFSDDEIVALKERGLSVVIDKFEKVE